MLYWYPWHFCQFTREKREKMLQYLIVCPLVFLAGFVDSIAGGGGLISLPAYIIAGVPAHFAIGTNKMSSTLGTSVSTWRYLKNGYLKGKNLIQTAVCACLTALLGSYIGSSLSLLVSDNVIKHMMMVVLPIVAFMCCATKIWERMTEKRSSHPEQCFSSVCWHRL